MCYLGHVLIMFIPVVFEGPLFSSTVAYSLIVIHTSCIIIQLVGFCLFVFSFIHSFILTKCIFYFIFYFIFLFYFFIIIIFLLVFTVWEEKEL